VKWGSASERVLEGLPEERKALALRYTIDAEEAQRREHLAAGAAAGRVQAGSRAAAESSESASGPRPALAPAVRRLASARRASERQESRLSCARCGRHCSHDAGDWTLRLFGDDQLHAVCRECDARDFSNAGGLGSSLVLRAVAD
jgi:hypothetical protein